MSKTQYPFTTILLLTITSFFDAHSQTPIHQSSYVQINGIDQWITIKGKDKSNPTILFIHGGPGSTFNPFADNVFSDWEEEFVLVQWDQRGAGRTYGKNAPEEQTEDFIIENPLTFRQMVEDGIAVAEYLVSTLDQSKIILTASSWGTSIAATMALERPDLFHAYIGHAQMVHPSETIKESYAEVKKLTEENKDLESIKTLSEIGPPPYDHPRKMGQLNRIIKKYEALHSTPAPESWWVWTSEYENPQDKKWRFEGDDYSFLYYAGFDKMGIAAMANEINLPEKGFDFQIPVYLLQGKHDILTSPAFTKPYFEKIQAPKKEYIVLPNSGHDFSEEMIEAEWKILMEDILPEIE